MERGWTLHWYLCGIIHSEDRVGSVEAKGMEVNSEQEREGLDTVPV
jgi:hypothetical protein